MKLNEIQRSFERNMNHNYLVIRNCHFFNNTVVENQDYRIKMLQNNKIEGLMIMTSRNINGDDIYYYDINSLVSMEQLYEKHQMCYEELKNLLLGCIDIYHNMENYLLEGDQLLISPEFIYLDVDNYKPYFVYYPKYDGDVRNNFRDLIDYLITKVDHQDSRAVTLVYQVHHYTRYTNYALNEIKNMIYDINEEYNMQISEISQGCEQYNDYVVMDNGDNYINIDISDEYQQYSVQNNIDYLNDSQLMIVNNKFDIKSQLSQLKCKSKNLPISKILSVIVGIVIVLICGFKVYAGSAGGNEQLYMCGIMVMGFFAAGISLYSYKRKKQQVQEAV